MDRATRWVSFCRLVSFLLPSFLLSLLWICLFANSRLIVVNDRLIETNAALRDTNQKLKAAIARYEAEKVLRQLLDSHRSPGGIRNEQFD
jgi:hypothetical protein